MSNSVYNINKGINRSIEFKGLKAQYIWYLGAGVIGLLILFAIIYIAGIPPIVCVAIILLSGGALLFKIYSMSNKYGEHGMMKAIAKKSVPRLVKANSRKVFIDLKRKK